MSLKGMLTEKRLVDLRSDTVTVPSDAMRAFMMTARVGDDVYEEDPSVNELEAMGACLLGKESSIFVSSGSMGNLIAAIVHCRDKRSELVCGSMSHVARDELGGVSALGGIHTFQVNNLPDGTLDPQGLREAVLAEDDVHWSVPRAVFLEDTHGNCGGRVLPPGYADEVLRVCKQRTGNHVALHCDGARLWNAAIAREVDVKVLAAPFDSVTCCLSKGLGAPMGSLLAGSSSFVKEARWVRKMLGGGMRQIGIMAAAGIFALQHNRGEVLARDHANAMHMTQVIAERVAQVLPRVSVTTPQTNIFFVRTDNAGLRDRVVQQCAANGVRIGSWPDNSIRCVANLNVSANDAERAATVIADALCTCFAGPATA